MDTFNTLKSQGRRGFRLQSKEQGKRFYLGDSAVYLAANGIEAVGPGEVGIVEVLEPDPDAWEV